MTRLLVVEDEAHLASALRLNFELEGYVVEVAKSLREAGEKLVQVSDLGAIVLDVMLPDGDGFGFCKKLRDSGNTTPVIMLTAKGSAQDRVKGLDAGADDYIGKPFDLPELLARLRSVLRRRSWSEKATSDNRVLIFAAARIDFETHAATSRGGPVKLTRLELDLLRYFADHEGRVLSREELLEHVWQLHNYPNTRTVDNFIVRLRKYFEPDPNNPVHFVSHRGAGYRFVRTPSS